LKDWLPERQRLSSPDEPTGFTTGFGQPSSWPGRSAVALLAIAGVAVIKLLVGDALGRQAPFALLGLGVLIAGWLAGAGGALLATVILTAVSWYLFFPTAGRFGVASPTAALQLTVFFLEGLAISGIVVAIERARRREEVARRRLEALADVSIALSAASTIDQVAGVVVDRGTTAMGADICTLYVSSQVSSKSERSLELIGHRGVAPEVLERIRHITSTSENPSLDTLTTGKAIWGESQEAYRSLYPGIASIRSTGPRARSFWSVPLIVEGRPIGLLGMGFHRSKRFPIDERSFVETFTRHCAQALLRARRLDAEHEARRQAERAQASLATTLRSIGDAVLATDTSGRVTFMNSVAESLTGWSAAEARDQPLPAVFKIINEHTREEVENPVDKVLKTGLVVGLANHTVLVSRRPGHETQIDDSGAPIRDELGQIQGVVLVFRDVSEKKKQEARRIFVADATATLASSLDYQTTLTRLAELMVPGFGDWAAVDIVDPQSPIPRRLAVTHVDPGKIELAHELARRYPDPPDSPSGVPNVLRTGRSEIFPDITEDMVIAGARDDEHRRILLGLHLRSAMIVPLVARGQTLGAISLVHAESGRRYTPDDLAFIEDIARRAAVGIDNARLYASERQARLAADVANRTKDEFLATVSHELRTPLNAILGWSRMMAKAPDDEKRRQRAVETIERNSVAMAKLIEDLLDVSRIISGSVRLDLERLDPARVIQGAVDAVRPSFEARGVRVSSSAVDGAGGDSDASPRSLASSLDPTARTVTGDGGRLQQVVCNLLSNAIKFTPRGGHVAVVLRERDSGVEIEVSDTGKGIEPAFLPHVFEPFRQADGSITRSHGGLGLGLAISRHLVELHGGKIRAESAGLGRGATFTVWLPVATVAGSEAAFVTTASSGTALPAPSPSSAGAQRRSALLGLKILAVDDDPDARQLVRAVLEERGARVRLAANAAEAMDELGKDIPDVLLSDIGMPGEDGYALIRKVRALPPLRGGNVPAAALTAYTRGEDRHQVLMAGYSMHVPKPIEPDHLISVVETLAVPARGGRSL